MENESIHLFIDTNILLHYPEITKIEWQKLCGCHEIVLIVCMQVIHEIDEKKNDPSLSKRARDAIKIIDKIDSSGGMVSNGVRLYIFDDELRGVDSQNILSSESGDERILRSVLLYREKDGIDNVLICSEDYGMKLRAKACGVKYLEMDKSTRRVSPKAEHEKKYDELYREYEKLKLKIPCLDVLFITNETESGKAPLSFMVNTECAFVDIESKIGEEKKRLYREPPMRNDAPDKYSIVSDLLKVAEEMKDAQYSSYAKNVEKYLDELKKYFEQINRFRESKVRSVKFFIKIVNLGTAPADDVDVFIYFPPLFSWVTVGDETIGDKQVMPRKPKEPYPLEYFSSANLIAQHLDSYQPWGADHELRLPPFGPKKVFLTGKADEGFCAQINVDKVKHGFEKKFFIKLGFKYLCNLSPFEVVTDITADNLPESKKKKIPIIIKNLQEVA